MDFLGRVGRAPKKFVKKSFNYMDHLNRRVSGLEEINENGINDIIEENQPTPIREI